MPTFARPQAGLVPLVALSSAMLLSGCLTMPGKSDTTSSSPAPSGTTAAAAPTASKVKAGMNDRGEVTDPKKIESGSGRTVKGLNGYEGEIVGVPVAGSKFTQLQIGMPLKQVLDIVGQPTDQGAYVTGKAFIPSFFGSDRYRQLAAEAGPAAPPAAARPASWPASSAPAPPP